MSIINQNLVFNSAGVSLDTTLQSVGNKWTQEVVAVNTAIAEPFKVIQYNVTSPYCILDISNLPTTGANPIMIRNVGPLQIKLKMMDGAAQINQVFTSQDLGNEVLVSIGESINYILDGKSTAYIIGVSKDVPVYVEDPLTFPISETTFNAMFPNRNEIFSYDGLVLASNKFAGQFLTGATDDAKLEELLCFLSQCSHETTGDGYSSGTFNHGLYFVAEGGDNSAFIPAYGTNTAGTQSYQGRGGLQLTYETNYTQAMAGIPGNTYDIVNNPELVGITPELAFETAIWFWVTAQAPKPSCSAVINQTWTPTANDIEKNRTGATFFNRFGVCTDIINGGIEAGSWDGSAIIPLGNGMATGNDDVTNKKNAQAINRQQYYTYFRDTFFSDRTISEFTPTENETNAAYNMANFLF